jgi:hypothetical protein
VRLGSSSGGLSVACARYLHIGVSATFSERTADRAPLHRLMKGLPRSSIFRYRQVCREIVRVYLSSTWDG